MDTLIKIWRPEIALLASALGVILVQFALFGGTMVTNALRNISEEINRSKSKQECTVSKNADLQNEIRKVLQLEFESQAIFFKITQSVGISFYLGCILACISLFWERSPNLVAVCVSLSVWLSNLVFLLIVLTLLFLTIAYSIHRLADRRLRGLQERLDLIRLKCLVRC